MIQVAPSHHPHKSTLAAAVVVVVVAVSLALAGCTNTGSSDSAKNSSAQTSSSKADSPRKCKFFQDRPGNQSDTVCADGRGTVDAVASVGMPEGFPTKEVPLPPGETTAGYRATQDSHLTFSVTRQVPGEFTAAMGRYRARLERAGFAITADKTAKNQTTPTIPSFKAQNDDWSLLVVGYAFPPAPDPATGAIDPSAELSPSITVRVTDR